MRMPGVGLENKFRVVLEANILSAREGSRSDGWLLRVLFHRKK